MWAILLNVCKDDESLSLYLNTQLIHRHSKLKITGQHHQIIGTSSCSNYKTLNFKVKTATENLVINRDFRYRRLRLRLGNQIIIENDKQTLKILQFSLSQWSNKNNFLYAIVSWNKSISSQIDCGVHFYTPRIPKMLVILISINIFLEPQNVFMMHWSSLRESTPCQFVRILLLVSN